MVKIFENIFLHAWQKMARASFGLYNTREEVDALVEGIQKAREVFA